MALQKNIKLTDNFGIEVEILNAYIKVSKVECTKQQVNCIIEIKKDTSSTVLVYQNNIFDYNINGENPIKQAYLHLKSLPEFVDATDC